MKRDYVDYYPAGRDGHPPETPFFLMMDRREADHVLTLRSDISASGRVGIELARFNRHALMASKHGDRFAYDLVDLLNESEVSE